MRMDIASVCLDRALVREPFGSGLVAGGEEPVLAGGAGSAAPQAPGAGGSPFGDERDGAVLQELESRSMPSPPGE